MSSKSPKIAAVIASCQGQDVDPHYLGYFLCFNSQRYFEAHEVLEELWLPQRRAAIGDFYKGLIQLAGAFVHLQKARPGPAAALFRLARANLQRYPAVHEQLETRVVLDLIESWLRDLQEQDPGRATLTAARFPTLSLVPKAS